MSPTPTAYTGGGNTSRRTIPTYSLRLYIRSSHDTTEDGADVTASDEAVELRGEAAQTGRVAT